MSATDDLDVITTVTRLIHSSLELQQALDGSVEAAVFAVGAERGFLVLVQPDGGREVAAVINITAAEVAADDAAYSRTALAEAERLGAPFVTNDATAEPGLLEAKSVHQRRLHAIACVPMRTDKLVGFVYVDTRERLGGFSARDVRLLEIVGDMAASAIERAMLVRQLRHNERLAAIGTLAAGVAHELNGPLGNILACHELLLSVVPTSGQEDLEVIRSEARRCAAIIRGLLSLARAQTLRREAVDVVEVARRALKLRQRSLAAAGVQVTDALGDRAAVVRGEPELLLQVLLNLVINAEQAMEAVPHSARQLSLTCVTDPQHVELNLDDSGPGIPEAARAHLFDPFVTTKGVGTGLGLSLCAGIMRSHAGTITVGRSPVGGASFRIRLPLDAET